MRKGRNFKRGFSVAYLELEKGKGGETAGKRILKKLFLTKGGGLENRFLRVCTPRGQKASPADRDKRISFIA